MVVSVWWPHMDNTHDNCVVSYTKKSVKQLLAREKVMAEQWRLDRGQIAEIGIDLFSLILPT